MRNRGDGAPPIEIFAVDNMLRLGPQAQGGQAINTFGITATPIGCCGFRPRMKSAKRSMSARPLAVLSSGSLAVCSGIPNCVRPIAHSVFGWKDQHFALLGFAGDAYLNEMGITNPVYCSRLAPVGSARPMLKLERFLSKWSFE